MFSPTGTGISTGICWKAESRNGPCRGPFLQSFRGKLFQGKSFLTPVKLRIKSVEVFGVKALLNEPEGFTETLEMDNLSCPQEADGVRHIGIPDCSEDVIVGRPGLLFCSHVFRQIGNDISLGLELAGIKRNAPGSLRPERRGMVDIIGTEAGVFDFFHGQVFGELIDDGADHFEMSEFVGTLRLSVIFIQVISDLGGCRFGYTADGLPGYKKEGADTVYPFKNGGYLAIMVNSHTSYIDNTTAVISINCSRKIEDDISFHDNENGFPITFNKQGRYRIRYTYLHGMNITVKLLQNDNLIHTISSPTRNVEYFYDINAEVGDKFSMTYTTSQTAVWFDCLITIEKI